MRGHGVLRPLTAPDAAGRSPSPQRHRPFAPPLESHAPVPFTFLQLGRKSESMSESRGASCSKQSNRR